ncbi:MAG TPA: DUF5658 family protein [Candidatus Cloacimonadota bacterium]|nr:DUF5658 family protein [Candidatus Cloacimonadota bacterium]
MQEIILKILMSEKVLCGQCLVFLLLNILDGYTTWLVMKPDHYERERNPIARYVFKKLKAPFSIVIFKAVLLSLLGIFIYNWREEAFTLNIALIVGNLLYFGVVLHNNKVHKRYAQREKLLSEMQKIRWIAD